MTSLRVLHVEDLASDADLARHALAKSAPDIQLDHAATFAIAIERLSADDFDVLLADLSLPDGSGLELLARVRERDLPMAAVILTGSGDQTAAIAALKAGADDYLVKRNDYLKRLPQVLHEAFARQRESSRQRGRILRVLYVEHDEFDIDLLRRHLAHHAPHIRLDLARTSEAALDKASRAAVAGEPHDIVLTDFQLPGMDGLELARELRARCAQHLPIVLLTGHGSEELAARALHLGIDDYLPKREGYLFEVPAILEKAQRGEELRRERETLRATNERFRRLAEASASILYSLSVRNGALHPTWVSENVTRLLGYPVAATLTPDWWWNHIHPDDREPATAAMTRLFDHGSLLHEYRFFDATGGIRWIRDELKLLCDSEGQPTEVVGVWLDVSSDRREAQLRDARSAVLDQVLKKRPLATILDDVALRLERLDPDLMASILTMDPLDGRLQLIASPSLPASYIEMMSSLEPDAGCCAFSSAASLGETVVVADIAPNPDCQPCLQHARKSGVAACWATPFKDETGRVIGLLALHSSKPRKPTEAETALMEEFAQLTALAVTKLRDQETLNQAAMAIAATRDGVFITDLNPKILAVNRAFTDITGYQEREALGRNPSLLQSGRQGRAFYQAMWRDIIESGHWTGEVWNRRKNGEIYPQWLSISTVRDEAGEPRHYVGVFTDISKIKASEALLEHLAHYDPLTDLPNRLLMQSRLKSAVERAARHGHRVAALFLDLDHFKHVNDSLGHPLGDELLVAVARRLRERLRDEDTLARLGGDEFLLLLDPAGEPRQVATVAQSLLELLDQPFTLSSGNEVFAGLSIGISLYPDDAGDATELVKHADAAMYLAKKQGRNAYRFHTEALTLAATERLSLETKLRYALERKEFSIHYQPLVDAGSGRATCLEALARWQPAGEAMVPPDKFIPLAEDTGMIIELGAWMLSNACMQAEAWRQGGLALDKLSVNISAREFHHGSIVEQVTVALAASGLPPGCLELELTESMLMLQAERAIATMLALKSLGVSLALDDFGTGYSSLAYLKRFPIDVIKIDKTFVQGMAGGGNDWEIVSAMAALARSLHMELVAEGVETREQVDALVALGCDKHQGYLYSPPLAPETLVEWLRARQ